MSANAPADVQKRVSDDDYNVDFYYPAIMDALSTVLAAGNTAGVDARTLYNWFYYMTIQNFQRFLPSSAASSKKLTFEEMLKEHRRSVERHSNAALDKILKRKKKNSDAILRRKEIPWEDADLADTDPQDIKRSCVQQNADRLEFASSRVYVDAVLPNPDERAKIKSAAGQLLTEILVAFQSMIDQLDWMSDSSKGAAYAKIDNIYRNLGYSDIAVDDAKLSSYYQTLSFPTKADYEGMRLELSRFGRYSQLANLARSGGTDRTSFAGFSAATVNAFYQPMMNSITLPLAILQQPFFDADWPTSVNHGAMGVVLGHELTHGFDNQGVQWDSTGKLDNWLDPASQQAFDQMAQCVIDQYSGFCPLDADKYKPNCIDGAQTQGENIADNGAIRASFRAYRNVIGLNGPDPRLPGSLVSQYSHDQLYFLGFANVWCDHETDDQYEQQIKQDSHSPGKYRVLGALQNYQVLITRG
ncbi:Protein NEP-17 b [Aphelenchoides avenae]|nr:Protein NEP-17 b [Aphelenchus avenae]